ncbi:cAMP-dependent protein kinase catalytic subunit alpha [Smittium mucronatum]|uniref:cAMP-dependent protein kinase n=1 Tax=Smittium mucronatum TaxID=133383 RepID=A0A1R0H7U5_9FUNG|nr:cAMP-dependent protein kinase catalytic subunit alpha [Smittium mucronatum]
MAYDHHPSNSVFSSRSDFSENKLDASRIFPTNKLPELPNTSYTFTDPNKNLNSSISSTDPTNKPIKHLYPSPKEKGSDSSPTSNTKQLYELYVSTPFEKDYQVPSFNPSREAACNNKRKLVSPKVPVLKKHVNISVSSLLASPIKEKDIRQTDTQAQSANKPIQGPETRKSYLMNPPDLHSGNTQSLPISNQLPGIINNQRDISSLSVPLKTNPSHYSLDNFSILKTLGTGTFGRVYLCKEKKTSNFYAVKVLKKAQVVKLKQVEHISNEKRILSFINHNFIVSLKCSFQDVQNLYMVMEFVPGGELFSHLRRAGRFPTDVARFYASEIVLAIEYLHKYNIIYRDMKPENLLLDREGHIKIADFGFAKYVVDRTWTLCGTPEYLAPEIIRGKGHGKPVDWWAIGILIFEMITGYPPFYDNNPFGTYGKILAGEVNFPSFVSHSTRDIISSLLTVDVGHRLGNLSGGSNDVKNHPWFFKIHWYDIYNKLIVPPIIPNYDYPGDSSNFDSYPEPQLDSEPEPGIDPYYDLFQDF